MKIRFGALKQFPDHFIVYVGENLTNEDRVQQHETGKAFPFSEIEGDDDELVSIVKMEDFVERIPGSGSVLGLHIVCQADGFTICGTFYGSQQIEKIKSRIQ